MCYSIAQMKKRTYDAALREGASQEMIDKLFREWQAAEEGEDNVIRPRHVLRKWF
jgi:hypothetical protein